MSVSKERRVNLVLRLTKEEIIDCRDANSDGVKVTRRKTCHSFERTRELRTVTRPRIVRFRVKCIWQEVRIEEIRLSTKEERCWRLLKIPYPRYTNGVEDVLSCHEVMPLEVRN